MSSLLNNGIDTLVGEYGKLDDGIKDYTGVKSVQFVIQTEKIEITEKETNTETVKE